MSDVAITHSQADKWHRQASAGGTPLPLFWSIFVINTSPTAAYWQGRSFTTPPSLFFLTQSHLFLSSLLFYSVSSQSIFYLLSLFTFFLLKPPSRGKKKSLSFLLLIFKYAAFFKCTPTQMSSRLKISSIHQWQAPKPYSAQFRVEKLRNQSWQLAGT